MLRYLRSRIIVVSGMSAVYGILFILFSLAALSFIVRILCAPFSSTISDEMQDYKVFHRIWAFCAFVGVLLIIGPFILSAWPPDWVERREQRRELAERIQAAGGWDALKRDCSTLVEQHRHEPFTSHRNTNGLPPALAALRPQEVRFDPPELLVGSGQNISVPVVRIRIFGMRRTGGNASPYLGLEVVCSTNTTAYQPRRSSSGGVPGNRHSRFRKVAENVFEIY